MYPFIRMASANRRARKMPKGDITTKHEITTRIWPWDIDIFRELNNGRTLTLYDLARFGLAVRVGLDKAMRQERVAIPVLGATIRYRRRVTLGQKVTVSAQLIGIDERFYYILQEMKRDDKLVGQAVFRMGFARNGIVPPSAMFEKLAIDIKDIPTLPSWIRQWIDSENNRPWPVED